MLDKHILIQLSPNTEEFYLKKFFEEIERIKSSDDPLAKNYADLDLSYSKFPVFHCLFKDDNLVAFSAIQTNPFPEGLCRLLTRFYIAPNYRFKKKYVRLDKPALLTEIILKSQLQWAKDNKLKIGFISMQHLKRRSYLKRWTDLRNENPGYGKWYMHNNLYLTCPYPKEKSCWQLISSTTLNGDDTTLCLPKMSIKDYKKRWG